MADNCCSFFFSILWLAFLLFIAWPIAFAAAIVWLLLQPFEALLGNCAKSTNHFLEKLVTWPRECGKAIVDGSRGCPHPR